MSTYLSLQISGIEVRSPVLLDTHFYVSSHGSIWNQKLKRWETRKPEKNGRSYIGIWKDKKLTRYTVAWFVLYCWFAEPTKERFWTLHKSSKKDSRKSLDNCVLNLYWGTPKENSADMIRERTSDKERVSEEIQRSLDYLSFL